MPRQTVTAQRKNAELLAFEALGFIAADPQQLELFLAVTGLDPASIRAAVGSPGFLAAVLEHLSSDERLLLAFAENRGGNPAEVPRALQALRGPEWERETA